MSDRTDHPLSIIGKPLGEAIDIIKAAHGIRPGAKLVCAYCKDTKKMQVAREYTITVEDCPFCCATPTEGGKSDADTEPTL